MGGFPEIFTSETMSFTILKNALSLFHVTFHHLDTRLDLAS